MSQTISVTCDKCHATTRQPEGYGDGIGGWTHVDLVFPGIKEASEHDFCPTCWVEVAVALGEVPDGP